MRKYMALSLLCVSATSLLSMQENPAGRFAECEELFKRSEYQKAAAGYESQLGTLNKGDASQDEVRRAHINYGETLMALGQYKKGGEEFEHRLGNTAMGRVPLQKPWDGSDPKDKTVVVRVEHGLGDTFFAMRNIKQLNALGATVYVRAQGFMKAFLERQDGVSGVITNNEQEAALPFDYDVYTLSLPRFVSKHGLKGVETHDDIAFSEGYLKAREDRVEYWKQQLSNDGAKKRRALVWCASKYVAGEVRSLQRDIPLQLLVDALQKDGVVLYSLQGGGHYPISKTEYESRKATGTLGELNECDILEDPSLVKTFDDTFDKTCGSFEDTAAVMCVMEGVYSVDTSTGMLAGALGAAVKDFHLLLPHESDWRHGVGKPETTPYFSNAKLHWQQAQGDWSNVVQDLSKDV